MADTHIITQGPRIQQVQTVVGTPKGYQQITVSTSAVALTVPKNATSAIIIVQDQTVRWRDDGTAPTATVGMPVFPGNVIQLNSAQQIADFRAIRDTSADSDAILNITYYS